MRGREIIRLDGRVVAVVSDAVFRVELDNGHRLVAYTARAERERARAIRPGDRVPVELSPFDMSTGRIVMKQEAEA